MSGRGWVEKVKVGRRRSLKNHLYIEKVKSWSSKVASILSLIFESLNFIIKMSAEILISPTDILKSYFDISKTLNFDLKNVTMIVKKS